MTDAPLTTANDRTDLRRSPPSGRRVLRHGLVAVCVAGWVALVGVGFAALQRYGATPGHPTAAPLALPADVLPGSAAWRALLFVHPRCPCTAATLRELERALARAPGLTVAAFVYLPAGEGPAWADGRLLARLRALPRTGVTFDPCGTLASRFGATTSGTVVLYGPDGRRAFQGGVTPSRAHEGPNLGTDALVSAALGASGGVLEHPVFGCPLFDAQPACAVACGRASCCGGRGR